MSSSRKGRRAASSPPPQPEAKRPKQQETAEFDTSTGLHQPIGNDSIGCFPDLVTGNTRTAFDIKAAIDNAPSVLPKLGTIPVAGLRQVQEGRCIWRVEDALEWAVEKAEKNTGFLTGITTDQFIHVQTVQQSLDEIASSYCFESGSLDFFIRGEMNIDKWPGEGNVLHDDAFTVSIALPTLQKALGRPEGDKLTIKQTDFLLPLSTFADPSVSGNAPPSHTTPSTKLITQSTRDSIDILDHSKSLLDALYVLGVPSPYGKVSTLETVVDESVHKARQIDVENFSVSPQLIEKLESLWAERFYPATVRIEPYKIKLYDPWGQFSEHKDTPESGLVGTFLVGLSLDVNLDQHLEAVGRSSSSSSLYDSQVTKWRSSNGSFCAFYSDVPHKVVRLRYGDDRDKYVDEEENEEDTKFALSLVSRDPKAVKWKPTIGHPMRGTIAFKVFLKEPQEREVGLISKVADSLNSLQRPFGILLRHDYTTECHQGLLKGADAVLYKTLQSLRDAKILVLPVLTTLYTAWDVTGETGCEEDDKCDITVYPFNDAMIQASRNGSKPGQWPNFLTNIPFLTSGPCSTTWSNITQQGAERTGNQSIPEEEHSIYISGAIIVLSE